MSDEKSKRKRRSFHLIINKEFQVKFTVYFVVLNFLSIVLLWSTIFFVFKVNINKITDQWALQETLKWILNATNYFFFWEGLGILALGTLLALIVSREIIGPLLRVETDLKQIKKQHGAVREIRIRKGDYFQGLVKEINELLEK